MSKAQFQEFCKWYDKHLDPSAPLGSFLNPDPRKPAHDSEESVEPAPEPEPKKKQGQRSGQSRKHRRRPSCEPAANDLDSVFKHSKLQAPVPSPPRQANPQRRSSLRGGRRASLEERHVHFDPNAMPVAHGPRRPNVEGMYEYIEKGTIGRSASPDAQPRTSMSGKNQSSSSGSERSSRRRQKERSSRVHSPSPPPPPPKIPISHTHTPSSTSFARHAASAAMQSQPPPNNTTATHDTHRNSHSHQPHHPDPRRSQRSRNDRSGSASTDSSSDTFVLAPSHNLSPESQCMPPASVSHHHYHYNDAKTHSPERRTCEDCLRLGRVQVGTKWYCRDCAPAARERHESQRHHWSSALQGDGAGDEHRDAPTQEDKGKKRPCCSLCNKRLPTPHQRGVEPLCHDCRAITTGAYPQPAPTHLGFGHDIPSASTGTSTGTGHDAEIRKKCIICSARYA
ncbi:MAG: hypothetical protein Q9183_006133, partial [Haloplaca sp. 2 TL-2023]